MKRNLIFAGLIVAIMAVSSLFLVSGCQVTSTSGPTVNNLQLLSSGGTQLVNGSTTTSRVLTIAGTVEDTSITTLELTVNSVSMIVPITVKVFNQSISLTNGTNTITLTVRNSTGGTTTATWTITANISAYGIHAQLTWDTASDMDLHFNKSSGTITDTMDCYYARKAPNWDGTGSNTPGSDTILYPGNPVLDVDNTTAYGPENTVLVTPVNGQTYWVKVRAYSGYATPVVRIYINDVLTNTFTCPRAITSSGTGGKEVWTVCTIAWSASTGTVTAGGTIGTSSVRPTVDTK